MEPTKGKSASFLTVSGARAGILLTPSCEKWAQKPEMHTLVSARRKRSVICQILGRHSQRYIAEVLQGPIRFNSLTVRSGAAHEGSGMSEKAEEKQPRRRAPARKKVVRKPSKQWVLNVQQLGKIAEAKIELAPLTLLLGKNNAGKSYLAMLMWALTELNNLLSREYVAAQRPRWFQSLFSKKPGNEAAQLVLTQERAKELVQLLHSALETEGAKWLSDVFVFDAFSETKISIEPSLPLPELTVTISATDVVTRVAFSDAGGSSNYSIHLPSIGPDFRFAEDFIFCEIMRAVVFGTLSPAWRRPLYIPAARTGLMLAFPALVSEMFGGLSLGNQPKLNMPTANFLQSLAYQGRQVSSGKMVQIADWLEEKALHGKVLESKDKNIRAFSYRAEGSELNVPLHAASSMVTELAPFLMMLKRPYAISLLVIEEPEAHLHLSAQRLMAQAIARIVNSGVPVIVTSHSDTFVQEINNLIQLHSSPERERLLQELSYDRADLINPTEVKGYEFSESGSLTSVTELELVKEGFIVPSLNEAIRQLAEETVFIQEGAEEEDD